ncbi:hypothetical protein SRB17_13930 [Streptomyces sp. RB17]|nr:hypothetical protein [Streptomyces sp. RB17]
MAMITKMAKNEPKTISIFFWPFCGFGSSTGCMRPVLHPPLHEARPGPGSRPGGDRSGTGHPRAAGSPQARAIVRRVPRLRHRASPGRGFTSSAGHRQARTTPQAQGIPGPRVHLKRGPSSGAYHASGTGRPRARGIPGRGASPGADHPPAARHPRARAIVRRASSSGASTFTRGLSLAPAHAGAARLDAPRAGIVSPPTRTDRPVRAAASPTGPPVRADPSPTGPPVRGHPVSHRSAGGRRSHTRGPATGRRTRFSARAPPSLGCSGQRIALSRSQPAGQPASPGRTPPGPGPRSSAHHHPQHPAPGSALGPQPAILTASQRAAPSGPSPGQCAAASSSTVRLRPAR